VGPERVRISMVEKITVRIFLICLVSCATLVLSFMWGGDPSEVYFKIAATLFIVGLGSFLCWFVSMLYTLRGFLCEHAFVPAAK